MMQIVPPLRTAFIERSSVPAPPTSMTEIDAGAAGLLEDFLLPIRRGCCS